MSVDYPVYKSVFHRVFWSFLTMADKREEKPQVFQAKGMPDVIGSSEFAETALNALEVDVMHVVSTREIRACTNDILNREMLKLADEMSKFRKVIGSRMMEGESLEDSGAVQLSRLKPSFEAGWKAWRTSWDNREKEAYDAFISIMKCDPKSESEKKDG